MLRPKVCQQQVKQLIESSKLLKEKMQNSNYRDHQVKSSATCKRLVHLLISFYGPTHIITLGILGVKLKSSTNFSDLLIKATSSY